MRVSKYWSDMPAATHIWLMANAVLKSLVGVHSLGSVVLPLGHSITYADS